MLRSASRDLISAAGLRVLYSCDFQMVAKAVLNSDRSATTSKAPPTNIMTSDIASPIKENPLKAEALTSRAIPVIRNLLVSATFTFTNPTKMSNNARLTGNHGW